MYWEGFSYAIRSVTSPKTVNTVALWHLLFPDIGSTNDVILGWDCLFVLSV